MSATTAECFFDTNVLLYLVSDELNKAQRAEALLAEGGHTSVQVFNEFADTATRKYRMPWERVDEVLNALREFCVVHPLTLDTHTHARQLAARYKYRIYDTSIIASALAADCSVLYTEDLHGNQRIGSLRITNPFSG